MNLSGLASLVHPSATATLFEHSLGSLESSRQILDRTGMTAELGAKYVEVAALLARICCGPFGPNSEETQGFRPEWFDGVTFGKGAVFPFATTSEALAALLLQLKLQRGSLRR